MSFVRAVVGAIVLGCGLYVLLSYASAFLKRPAAWSVRLVRAAFIELLCALMVVPLWPLWWLLGGVSQASEEGEGVTRGRPVVLLHGFAMNRTQWLWMARRLRARGHGPIYGMNYFSLQSTARSARALGAFIDRVLLREQATQVDVIGHSLGGIVARYYIERLSGAHKVGRLVTIGTPHSGSRLGRFGPGIPSARELLDGSPLLTDLGPVRAGAPYTSIWSRADAIVQPPESASIAPGGADEVFDDLGHLSLILSPRVIDVIHMHLRT